MAQKELMTANAFSMCDLALCESEINFWTASAHRESLEYLTATLILLSKCVVLLLLHELPFLFVIEVHVKVVFSFSVACNILDQMMRGLQIINDMLLINVNILIRLTESFMKICYSQTKEKPNMIGS